MQERLPRRRRSHYPRLAAKGWTVPPPLFLAIPLELTLHNHTCTKRSKRRLPPRRRKSEMGKSPLGSRFLMLRSLIRIVNRQPESRVTSWRLKDAGARAWLWVKVSCSGPCQRKLTSQGQVQLTFHWFKETERGFIKKYSANLPVKGQEWRTWAVKSNLEPGKWKVTILTDSGRVCMDGNGKCDFLLDVMP